MSFAPGLLEAHLVTLESSPSAFRYIRKDSDNLNVTTEPISLSWKDQIRNEILDVALACSQTNWDSEGSQAISRDSIGKAMGLIELAPEGIRPPEIVPSSDGEIAFEWHTGRDRLLSLVPHGDSLIFAALLGSRNNRERGCKPYAAGWPDRVLEILAEYFPYVRSTTISNH